MATEARTATIAKIKIDLRITHTEFDTDLNDQIEACLGDLTICGVASPSESDPAILAALKLWCRANYTDDTVRAEAYMRRYDALKSCLMMAEGYGGPTL